MRPQKSEPLIAINMMTDVLHRTLNPAQVARRAVTLLQQFLDVYQVAIYALDPVQEALHLLAETGHPPETVEAGATLSVENSLSGHVVRQKKMVVSHDIGTDPRLAAHIQKLLVAQQVKTAVLLPLLYQNEALGTMNLMFQEPREFSALEQETLMVFARNIGLALANARYVAALQKIQEDLRTQRDFAQQIVENMGQGLTITDQDGRFSFVNRAFTNMLGYSSADLVGKTPFDISFSADTLTLHRANQQRHDNEVSTYETRLIHANGQVVHVLVTGAPQWQDGQYRGSIAVITDLTERKEAEKAQLRFANQLQTATEVARQINGILDPDRLLAEIVPLLQERFDLYHVHVYLLDETESQLIMRVGSGEIGQILLANRHAIPVGEQHSLVARALRERQAIRVNDVFQEPDFLPNPLLPHTRSELAVPLIVHERLWGVLDVQEDAPYRFNESDVHVLNILAGQIAIALQNATLFAEQQQAKAVQTALVNELEARNAELERFTYTVSHDLKSPLITIRGFLGLLEQDVARQDVQRIASDLARIRTATYTMETLLDDLLQLSRVGRVVSPPQVVPFAELVKDALERVMGRLTERGVTIVVEPDLPQVFVDRPRMVEVLQNLFDNGVKFMGDQTHPQILIGARFLEDLPVFFVQDNGVGIDARFQDRVFGLFERLDSSVEGTGIGLALVKRIIEVHNGRIWIESAGSGQGTTFCFTLPLPPIATGA